MDHGVRSTTWLLSTGPHAGKSTALLDLARQFAGAALELTLTPEDADPAHLLLRLTRHQPDLEAVLEALRARFPRLSTGALLGHAVKGRFAAVLVDDFHLIEGSASQAELEAFFRQLPPEVSLAVASRHRLPDLGRSPVVDWGADDPRWHEQPRLADLEVLPAQLRRRLALLALVGEAAFGSLDEALVARNIARRLPGVRVALREVWQEIAACLLSERQDDEDFWDEAEREALEVMQRVRRTPRDGEAAAMLARWPAARRRRSVPLRLEGWLCHDEGRLLEARECFEAALKCARHDAERIEAMLALLACKGRCGDRPGAEALIAQLQAMELTDDQLQVLALERSVLAAGCELPEPAIALLEGLVDTPLAGDRRCAARRFEAAEALFRLHLEAAHPLQAAAYAERLEAMATEGELARRRLAARLCPWLARLSDRTCPVPVETLLQVPNQELVEASPIDFNRYLCAFAQRAAQVGADAVAVRYLLTALRHAQQHRLETEIPPIRRLQLAAAARLGDVSLACALLAETPALRDQPAASYHWALCLAEAHQLEAALAALDEAEARGPDTRTQGQLQLLRLWLRHFQGDDQAQIQARSLLESPAGRHLPHDAPVLLERLGLRDGTAHYRLIGFGEIGVFGQDLAGVHWSRRKPRALLALLMACPEGLSPDTLISTFFHYTDSADPAAMLNTLVYHLRQVIKTLKMGELIETRRERYRIVPEMVAFCDVWDFMGLQHKGDELQAAGHEAVGGWLLELAGRAMGGQLFLDVEDDLGPSVVPLRQAVARIEAMGRDAGWR